MTVEADEPLKARSKRKTMRTGLMTAAADAPAADDEVNPRDHVSSLARGLEVLRAFNRTGRKMTLSEVAAETGNTRAGARRILLTLVHEGYAVADGKLFDLTPQVLELGYSVLSAKGTWDIARPFIDHLSDELRESVSAAVLDKFEVVYVTGSQYHRVISVGITVGARMPAHCTATGRVLLAGQPKELWPGIVQNIPMRAETSYTLTDRKGLLNVLQDVKSKGWAMVNQEIEAGLISVAVPVRDARGKLLGAISVGVPLVRTNPTIMEHEILPKLLKMTAAISQALKF